MDLICCWSFFLRSCVCNHSCSLSALPSPGSCSYTAWCRSGWMLRRRALILFLLLVPSRTLARDTRNHCIGTFCKHRHLVEVTRSTQFHLQSYIRCQHPNKTVELFSFRQIHNLQTGSTETEDEVSYRFSIILPNFRQLVSSTVTVVLWPELLS